MEIKAGNVYIPKPEWAGKLNSNILEIEQIDYQGNLIFFKNIKSPENLGIVVANIRKYWQLKNSSLVKEKLGLK